MICLTDEMREHVDNALANGTPCLLTTASPDGWPQVGPKGSMMVFDKEHLAYWERTKRAALENVNQNSKVTVYYRDPAIRVTYRFHGIATVYDDGKLWREVGERIVPRERAPDPDWKGSAVLVRVVKITTLAGQVLQEAQD